MGTARSARPRRLSVTKVKQETKGTMNGGVFLVPKPSTNGISRYPGFRTQAINHWLTDSEPMWSLPTMNVDHFLSFPVVFTPHLC